MSEGAVRAEKGTPSLAPCRPHPAGPALSCRIYLYPTLTSCPPNHALLTQSCPVLSHSISTHPAHPALIMLPCCTQPCPPNPALCHLPPHPTWPAPPLPPAPPPPCPFAPAPHLHCMLLVAIGDAVRYYDDDVPRGGAVPVACVRHVDARRVQRVRRVRVTCRSRSRSNKSQDDVSQ